MKAKSSSSSSSSSGTIWHFWEGLERAHQQKEDAPVEEEKPAAVEEEPEELRPEELLALAYPDDVYWGAQ